MYASIRHDVTSLGRRAFGRGGPRKPRRGTLALEDVSFEVGQGESFALIGPNGAGKSTVLRLISRISFPTAGRLTVRGRMAALMEVASGVHPELTGRENIWLFGQILGLRKADIRRRFDEIVDFAELGHAIDTPVKFFSSGMQMRLGFSIAVHLEPEVLAVDEALAVGDAAFQAKCLARLRRLISEGSTVLFVSHDLDAVETLCSRAALLCDGRMRSVGDVQDVVGAYEEWVENMQELAPPEQATSSTQLSIAGFAAIAANNGSTAIATGDDVAIQLRFRASEPLDRPRIDIKVSTGDHGSLIACALPREVAPLSLEGDFVVSCTFKALPLVPRIYEVWCTVRAGDGVSTVLDWQRVGAFRVQPAGGSRAEMIETFAGMPVLQVPYTWDVRRGAS